MRILSILILAAALAGCDDDKPERENTGNSCETVDECYPEVDHGDLTGEVVCMDRVEEGYCTHHCTTNTDCCAVENECESEFPQVCAPFESTGEMYCFLSCEGVEDENNYCQENAHPSFICRSTGGGGLNRKVCVPEG